MSGAAPGWYSDPGDARQYRYWDGWAWTAGVSRDGVVREQPITAQSATQVWAEREDHRAEWPARSVFIGVSGALGAIALAVGVSVAVDAVLDDQFLVTFVAAQLALWAGLLLTCVFVSRRYASNRLLEDYALSFRAIDLARGAVLSIIARVAAIPVIVPLVILLDLDSRDSLNDLKDVARGPVGTTITVIFLIIGAPLVEELFFRGLLQRSLESRFAPPVAIGIQALLFGLAHLTLPLDAANAVVFAGTAVAGVALGISAWRYHRLGPGIVAHSLFNLVPAVLIVFS